MLIIVIAATDDNMDEYAPPSALSGVKEKLIVTDLINQLDIMDGLKEIITVKESYCNFIISSHDPVAVAYNERIFSQYTSTPSHEYLFTAGAKYSKLV